jgi:hypothetical protein
MKLVLTRHRAAFGIIAVLAVTLFFALPRGWPASDAGYFAIRGPLAALWFAGLIAIAGSPYWKIIYREAPLRRAVTGVTDLDERELALRDRAGGLTYYLFFAVNLMLLVGAGIAADAGLVTLERTGLIGAAMPYAFFGVTLPVIMLEWFEPSHLWSEPDEEEEL